MTAWAWRRKSSSDMWKVSGIVTPPRSDLLAVSASGDPVSTPRSSSYEAYRPTDEIVNGFRPPAASYRFVLGSMAFLTAGKIRLCSQCCPTETSSDKITNLDYRQTGNS